MSFYQNCVLWNLLLFLVGALILILRLLSYNSFYVQSQSEVYMRSEQNKSYSIAISNTITFCQWDLKEKNWKQQRCFILWDCSTFINSRTCNTMIRSFVRIFPIVLPILKSKGFWFYNYSDQHFQPSFFLILLVLN